MESPARESAGTMVMVSGERKTRVEITRKDPEAWELLYQRRLTASEVNMEWSVPEGAPTTPEVSSLGPVDVLARALHQTALAFPLVRARLNSLGDSVEVRFAATVFDDGLTHQSFALTLSGFLNAVETFDLVRSLRAEQRAALTEFEARSAARVKQFSRSLTLEGID